MGARLGVRSPCVSRSPTRRERGDRKFRLVLGAIRGFFFFFQAEDGIRDGPVTGVQTCALPIFDRAIKIAQRAEMKIRIAAKIDNADREYMENEIQPLLDHQLVEFVGEVDRAQKQKLLEIGRASCRERV